MVAINTFKEKSSHEVTNIKYIKIRITFVKDFYKNYLKSKKKQKLSHDQKIVKWEQQNKKNRYLNAKLYGCKGPNL